MKHWMGQTYREENGGDGGDGGSGGDTGGDTGAAGGAGDTGGELANYFSAPVETASSEWRTHFAEAAGFEGDDVAKHAGQLDRVSDMGTLAKNYFSAQTKIRKGELSNGLPENPSDQQLSDWRTSHGVPTELTGYTVELADGLVLNDADTRIMEGIFPIAHKHNVSSTAMSEMTDAMLKGRAVEAQAVLDKDGIDKQSCDGQLKEAWGADRQMNINVIQGLVAQLPEGTRENFESARMMDGRAIFNDPAFMVAIADWARQMNPSATVVPNANNPVQAIDDEIKSLEDRMGDDDWFKDNKAQARYRSLLDAKAAMGT